jgi:hypothetical protein
MHVDFLSAVKGGFFLRKKPLSILPSVYSNSENAIRSQTINSGWALCLAAVFLYRKSWGWRQQDTWKNSPGRRLLNPVAELRYLLCPFVLRRKIRKRDMVMLAFKYLVDRFCHGSEHVGFAAM